MTGYLLDTNVLSEVLKKRPEPKVLQKLEDVREVHLATSVICVMELRFGAAQRADLDTFWGRIQQKLLPWVTLLPLTEKEAILAGDILAHLTQRGERIGTEDILIASTALSHDLTVSSRNVRHFGRIKGLKVEDWWR